LVFVIFVVNWVGNPEQTDSPGRTHGRGPVKDTDSAVGLKRLTYAGAIMRNLLALIGLAVVVFVVVGYTRGWYSFQVSASSDGKSHIAVDVDKNRIVNDGKEAGSKVGEFVDSFKNGPASGAPATLPMGK
jgi:hypothetical protein